MDNNEQLIKILEEVKYRDSFLHLLSEEQIKEIDCSLEELKNDEKYDAIDDYNEDEDYEDYEDDSCCSFPIVAGPDDPHMTLSQISAKSYESIINKNNEFCCPCSEKATFFDAITFRSFETFIKNPYAITSGWHRHTYICINCKRKYSYPPVPNLSEEEIKQRDIRIKISRQEGLKNEIKEFVLKYGRDEFLSIIREFRD
jgi:hypothetical protein